MVLCALWGGGGMVLGVGRSEVVALDVAVLGAKEEEE
jgi:hypothetical protein